MTGMEPDRGVNMANQAQIDAVFLIFMNRVTTGEVKYIMPPDVLLKTFALFILVAAIFIMGMEKIIAESTVSALLGAIATGVLGISLKKTE
ncbi:MULTISPECIES: hypothetical protein [Pseudomonas]|nr:MULTISPECIES: hypothetical protein [Pseudomonas syringae group]MDU8627712.1 hypothetical protein [Pseudomonas syringae group sp. 243L2]